MERLRTFWMTRVCEYTVKIMIKKFIVNFGGFLENGYVKHQFSRCHARNESKQDVFVKH